MLILIVLVLLGYVALEVGLSLKTDRHWQHLMDDYYDNENRD